MFGVYTYTIAMHSWKIVPIIVILYPLMSVVILFALLFEDHLSFLKLIFAGYTFFHHFTFNMIYHYI